MADPNLELLAEVRAVIEADVRAALLQNPSLSMDEVSQVMLDSAESLFDLRDLHE